MERLPQGLMVVGLGAVYQEHLANPLSSWVDPGNQILVDREWQRFETIGIGKKVVADINQPPFAPNAFSDQSMVVVISTPKHLSALISLIELGIERFVVEKPLVNSAREVQIFRDITESNPNIRIYAMEMCLTKVLPLYLLTGKIHPDDPRWEWVEDQDHKPPPSALYNSIEDQIGELEGIEGIVLEGGDFGVPDILRRPWLESDNEGGGMLLDLGTHILGL